MILKFIEAPLLASKDEAEAIGKLNEFLADLGKKPSQESKVELDEEVKVSTSVSLSLSLSLSHTHAHTHTHTHTHKHKHTKRTCLYHKCPVDQKCRLHCMLAKTTALLWFCGVWIVVPSA